VAQVARQLEVSGQTYHRWRNQFGGMKADDARRLKELERENRELKQIVADKELENRAPREIAKGNLVSPSRRRRAVVMLQDRLSSSQRGRAQSSASTAPPSATNQPSPTRIGTYGPGCGASRSNTRGGATGGPTLCSTDRAMW
jgi:putative transposase